jgi:hypothetical protein
MFQKPTPPAIKAAGKRLVEYALLHDVPQGVAIVDMVIVGSDDEVLALSRDQRLLAWYARELELEAP